MQFLLHFMQFLFYCVSYIEEHGLFTEFLFPFLWLVWRWKKNRCDFLICALISWFLFPRFFCKHFRVVQTSPASMNSSDFYAMQIKWNVHQMQNERYPKKTYTHFFPPHFSLSFNLSASFTPFQWTWFNLFTIWIHEWNTIIKHSMACNL